MKLFAKSLLALACMMFIVATSSAQEMPGLRGAWKAELNGKTHILLITNKHYTHTEYDLAGKKFIQSNGGTWSGVNDVELKSEFNTTDKGSVGSTSKIKVQIADDKLQLTGASMPAAWKRIDAGGGALNATWRISGREQNGQLHDIPPSARKTIKILTGTRFQWAAINTATGEFFGTGGGTYTFKDGRYTEAIEFFSRDSSRVGMQLSFEGEVKGNAWHHRGKSSKGDPIYEVWTKED